MHRCLRQFLTSDEQSVYFYTIFFDVKSASEFDANIDIGSLVSLN